MRRAHPRSTSDPDAAHAPRTPPSEYRYGSCSAACLQESPARRQRPLNRPSCPACAAHCPWCRTKLVKYGLAAFRIGRDFNRGQTPECCIWRPQPLQSLIEVAKTFDGPIQEFLVFPGYWSYNLCHAAHCGRHGFLGFVVSHSVRPTEELTK